MKNPENTRFMTRIFSATAEGDEELTSQVARDIEEAKQKGSVTTDELTYVDLGEGKVEITDNENGERTIAEKAEDGNYDLYPAGVEIPTDQPENYLHMEDDGVTPGDQVGAPDEKVEDHNPDETPAPTVEENAEGDVCPECGQNPCECGSEEDEEEKEFSVSTDNTVVLRIFSDQAYCERLFSEVIESQETAKVGDLKIEKTEEPNTVIVTDENSGDQAKVTMDDEEMDVQELDSKNFSEEGEETANEEEFMPLHVVGIDAFNHQIVDASEYSEESAQELVDRLQEIGIDGVQVFEDETEARDYAISLLESVGVEDTEEIEEPEQVEFSEHDVFVTRYNIDNTAFMTRLFSEACNDIDASQSAIENAIEGGDEVETDTEIITPVDDYTAIVEDKDNGELTKVVIDGDSMNCNPISEEEADELTGEKTYSNAEETKFFSENEDMTDYMCRLFSEEADEADIEKAIENNEQVETDSEIITPVDDETAVIEDKENGEYTKATMTDDDIDLKPISEEEAADLTEEKTYSNAEETKFFSENEDMTDYMCRLFSEEADEADIEKAVEEGEVVETEGETITPIDNETAVIKDKENGEYTKAVVSEDDIDLAPISEETAADLIGGDEDEEKKFSANPLDKFFAEVNAAAAPEPEVVPAVYDENGNLVPLQQGEEAAPSVEAIEDAALAAVQAISDATNTSVNAIIEAKNTPAEDEQAELQEAQFSANEVEESINNTNDTLVSWLGQEIGK